MWNESDASPDNKKHRDMMQITRWRNTLNNLSRLSDPSYNDIPRSQQFEEQKSHVDSSKLKFAPKITLKTLFFL